VEGVVPDLAGREPILPQSENFAAEAEVEVDAYVVLLATGRSSLAEVAEVEVCDSARSLPDLALGE